MEQSSSPPPVPAAAPSVPEDARPATRGDVRALRRWVLVAVVWAVAATAVSVIALIDQNNANSGGNKTSADVARQLSDFESTINRRIASLSSQLQDVPKSEDVSKLDVRLKKVETQATHAADDARKASDTATKVQDAVKTLQQSGGTTTSPSKP
jgi:TolA-binding protein